jgi:hypothetical protein
MAAMIDYLGTEDMNQATTISKDLLHAITDVAVRMMTSEMVA